ncbi:MAG TPA: lactate racemase domain-containing protein [Chthoniobacteraceae bacterium]|jgi:nickel-dependent lactate racemase|nr:lactate racemase domain-containing protein [Chthoniobacteraceae bacterium]
MPPTLSLTGTNGSAVPAAGVRELIAQACPGKDYKGRKILLIVPDATRTCPLGLLFKTLFDQIGGVTAALDVMIALGTHQPMSEEAICERLELTAAERGSKFASVRFFNHEWDNPAALRRIGLLSREDTRELTDGRFEMEVPVDVNAKVFEYDQLVIIGPVFPHEVVGFSGGNKYLFPGIGGPDVLNFFHWLGALVTNPMIIGNKWTPVRRVVDRVGGMVPVPKLCLCIVVEKAELAGLFIGSPEGAWDEASELSKQLHITYKDRPFHTVLSCAPKMYDELWVGGKCMYKLEPVVADGGELIIYAPHIHEISLTHGELIRGIGYHCRDYFLKQWDRFKDVPWGTIAHSTHVRGIGTYEDGVEKCRVRVTLATGIPKDICDEVNLGYRDPATIHPADYADREDEGILYVPKAGEMLYHLKNRPEWAREM